MLILRTNAFSTMYSPLSHELYLCDKSLSLFLSQTFLHRLVSHPTYNSFCVALGCVIVMSATEKTISLFLEIYSRHPSSISSLTASLEIIKFVKINEPLSFSLVSHFHLLMNLHDRKGR